MNLKKSLLKVFSSNMLQILSSAIIGFIIPAVLSIENYAEYKTYALIVAYLGLLHFGFPDGLYIKYGGQNYNSLDKEELIREYKAFLLLEIIITIVLFIIGLLVKQKIVFLISLTIIPFMITSFFKTIYQGTGAFDRYSKIIYISSISNLIINIVIAIIMQKDNYLFYCFVTIITNVITSIYCSILFIKDNKNVKKARITMKEYLAIKSGFFVLLGNLALVLFYGIDRWMVKIFLTTNDFAYYSFAINLLNIITVLINSISITFYTFLFKRGTREVINNLKDILILLGGYASCAYFPLALIISSFLKKYIFSLSIISNSFAAFPYMIIINSLYVNLYKIQKKERKYFFVVIGMLVISAIYNVIALIFNSGTFGISIATLLAFVTWFVFSYFHLKKFDLNCKNIICLFSFTFFFFISSHINNIFIGFVLYVLILLIISLLFYRKSIGQVVEIIRKKYGIKKSFI